VKVVIALMDYFGACKIPISTVRGEAKSEEDAFSTLCLFCSEAEYWVKILNCIWMEVAPLDGRKY
jgi:hypothetical protein